MGSICPICMDVVYYYWYKLTVSFFYIFFSLSFQFGGTKRANARSAGSVRLGDIPDILEIANGG